MHGIFGNVVAEVIRLAVLKATFYSATGHPHRKTTAMVVSPGVGAADLALAIDGATELTAPDDQRLTGVEESHVVRDILL